MLAPRGANRGDFEDASGGATKARIGLTHTAKLRMMSRGARASTIPRELAHQLAAISDENEIEERLQQAIDGALLELSQNPKLPPAPEENQSE